MKKIIGGKVYDTDKACCVGTWYNQHLQSDFSYCSESLYRKKSGEFFIYGEGGANTKYAVPIWDGWKSGENIVPLSYQSAQEWAKEHLNMDAYQKIFGEVADDDTKKNATFSLSHTAIDRLKRAAAQENVTVSAYLESLINSI